MIQPDHIHHFKCRAKSIQPPAVTVLGQRVPAINRIAPQLAGLAEIIRRHAGDHRGIALRVQLKILPIGPDVGAVVRDINRQVAHDPDAALARIFAQLSPLLEEDELQKLLRSDWRGELLGAIFASA